MLRSARAMAAVVAFFFSALAIGLPISGDAQSQVRGGTIISGRVLETIGGLPVGNAEVVLERNAARVATTKTAPDGSFAFPPQHPGTYDILILASGYQETRSQDFSVAPGVDSVAVDTAVQKASAGLGGSDLKTIGAVRARREALQTTATITEHVDPEILQKQNYIRAGDALGTLPFVNTSTSSSLGDDLGVSIRGFNSTETATLLDGHPIGPIGAKGLGFDYQLSQFWGLSSIDVTYGSGASGLYGANTIAGAVNFQTINPTAEKRVNALQGYGSFAKAMTGLTSTGTIGHLGYALAYGVQGTDGELGPPALITQTGLLTSAQNNCPAGVNSLPSVSQADLAGCTYTVSGAYSMRNAVAKLNYAFDNKTSLQFTGYNATMYAQSSGNGDTDFNTAAYLTYQATNQLAGMATPGQDTETLLNGTTVTCKGGLVVANDSPAGYQCMTPQQYGSTFAGPAGGGLGRWHAGRNQDYDARILRTIGNGTLLVDGYLDNYGYLNVKSLTGPFHDDIFRTHGALASYELAGSNNTLAFGLDLLHQGHDTRTTFGAYNHHDLATSGYFIRDDYTVTKQLTTSADLRLDRSHDTGTSNFDPRLSFIYRPSAADVVRLTAGHSFSEPDPSLLGGSYVFDASPNSLNPICGSGDLNSVGSGPSTNLQPEHATDFEVAYGHRLSLIHI